MNSPAPPGQGASAAGQALALAQDQASVAQARLDQLVEANQHLVLAALAARDAAQANAQALEQLALATEMDRLTALPNRALARARLTLAVDEARRSGGRVALLLLDLTDFRQINDTLGHAVGDQVLLHAARCLAASVRESDTVGRHGSDEFLVLLPDIPGTAQALDAAADLVTSLGAPFRLSDHVLRLRASVGISLYPDDGDNADGLIDRAVAAMYRAKWRGLDSFAFLGEAGTSARSLELRTLESLRNPLTRHELALAEHHRRDGLLQEANTQLVLAALTAQELQHAAQEAQRRQTEFLGVLAHELRHPLAPISNAAAILGRIPDGGPLLAKAQAVIERQVSSMSRLVGDLLDVSRAATGKLRIESRPVDLIALIDAVVDACRPAMDVRLQRFEVDLPGDEIEVHGDPVRLMQVFNNLLDNASKYTPQEGEIRLAVETPGGTVRLTVSDNGIGITPQALPHVFEPFVQDIHAAAFNASGLGLGLAVVRELVEAQGGTVVAQSAGHGLGSQFIVTLPLMRGDVQAPRAPEG